MTEDDELILHPRRGVDGLAFGMTHSEIAARAGPPDRVSRGFLKTRVELRAFLNVGYGPAPEERVVHFGIGRQMTKARLGDILVFGGRTRSTLQALCRLDSDPRLCMGFVVLYDLGMTLTGFHDNDVNQRAVTLFADGGEWDVRRAQTEPFRP